MVPPTSKSISEVGSSSLSVSLDFSFYWEACCSCEKNFSIALFRCILDALSDCGFFGALCLMEGQGHFALFTAMGGGKREWVVCPLHVWWNAHRASNSLTVQYVTVMFCEAVMRNASITWRVLHTQLSRISCIPKTTKDAHNTIQYTIPGILK